MNTSQARGHGVFLVTALLVHAGNYLFNLILSRQLGPGDFAELNLVVTLLLILTVVTHTVQLMAARMVGEADVRSGSVAAAAVAAWLRRRAFAVGAVAGVVLVVGAPAWRTVFNSPSAVPFVLFGLGMPWFVALGAARGNLQGRDRFARLAATNAVEMLVRLGGGIALVALGAGVVGAVAAITASFIFAGVVANDRNVLTETAPTSVAALRVVARGLVGPSLGLLVGQVLIANGDVLVVKASASPVDAGRYAALALVGRIVFYVTWSAVEVAFPIVVRRVHGGGDDRTILRWSVLGTACLGLAATGLTFIAPRLLLSVLFGPEYVAAAPLLWKYTLATSLFSVTFVIANHHLARGQHRASWLLAAGGVVQLVTLTLVEGDIATIVNVQIVVMAALLAAVAVAGAGSPNRRRRDLEETVRLQPA